MTKVSVDLEDLESLIFATAAIKSIESALDARKRDPFVKAHLPFNAAHDRLAAEMRNAKRADAGTLVPWDGELDSVELARLRIVAKEIFVVLSGEERLERPEIDRLMAKGMLEMGNMVTGVMWAGANAPELIKEPVFAIRATERGRQKLEESK